MLKVMNRLVVLSFGLFSTLPCAAEQSPVLGTPGTVATYELADEPLNRPAFETENLL